MLPALQAVPRALCPKPGPRRHAPEAPCVIAATLLRSYACPCTVDAGVLTGFEWQDMPPDCERCGSDSWRSCMRVEYDAVYSSKPQATCTGGCNACMHAA